MSFEDTGELAWGAACLGVTHPPGYPWLTMLGSLFARLPAGDYAFRLNLMSSVFGAASITAAFAGTRMLAARLRLPAWPAALAAAIALSVSRTLWWQAGIGEKYTASLALMAFALLALLKAWLDRKPERLPGAAFLCGLALSHHMHGLYLLPALTLAVWRIRFPLTRLPLLAFLAALPLAAKLEAIPIRSAANPELNWTVPDNYQRLARYASARQYRFIMFAGAGHLDLAGRALNQAFVLPLKEFGPALALAAPGLAVLRSIPGAVPGLGAVWAANLALALAYRTPEIERYYLLTFFLLACLIGLGSARLFRARAVWAAAVLSLLLIPAAFNSRTSPRHRHYLAFDFAVNQLAPLPPGAMLICEGDDQAFPLFYIREVLDFRKDIELVPMPFACSPEGYEKLKPHRPGLVFPAFNPDPGRHLPGIILKNSPGRAAFYSPGCTGARSESHLVPFGITFRVFVDPKGTEKEKQTLGRFPHLRLRGCVDAARYEDPVTMRAVGNYGFSLAYHGASALQLGRPGTAEDFLSEALRLPLREGIRAAAMTHLGMAYELQGDLDQAEAIYRQAIQLQDDFGPALLAYGRHLALHHPGHPETRKLLFKAMRASEYLTIEQRNEVRRLLSRPH